MTSSEPGKKIKLGSLKRKLQKNSATAVKKVKLNQFEENEQMEPTKPMANTIVAESLDTLISQMPLSNNNNRAPEIVSTIVDVDLEDEINQLEEGNSADTINDLLKAPETKASTSTPVHKISSHTIYKKLYQEHPELAALSSNEVESTRAKLGINIKSNINPISSWNHLGLPLSIASVLKSLAYPSPTPIQCQSLPCLMSGVNFIGIAQTGSGKTLAFSLPLIRYLLANKASADHDDDAKYPGSSPRAIILAPTRELSHQITKFTSPFVQSCSLQMATCHGGTLISNQISHLLSQKVDLVIATPGRLLDLLSTNGGKVLRLSHVGYMVVDEADRLLDMGFEPQLRKIFDLIRNDSQRVLFSATMPTKVERLIKGLVKNSTICKVNNNNNYHEAGSLESTNNDNSGFGIVDDVRQIVKIVTGETSLEINQSKLSQLLSILGQWNSGKLTVADDAIASGSKCIIFVERKDSCDKLVRQLINRGYASMALHGGKDQNERDGVIEDFSNGLINILVATSVAARGLDVEGLDLVVNFDSPNHIEDYVHRIGRTGRAGKKGTAITLLSSDQERYAWDLQFVISKCKIQEGDVDPQLAIMADKWAKEHNLTKPNSTFGFRGHGLEKLQSVRENQAKTEKSVYLEENQRQQEDHLRENLPTEEKKEAIKVTYIVNDASKVGARLHEAHLTINDLPQTARWQVSKGDYLAQVEDNCQVSIVVKGQYVAPGKEAKKGVDKLYLKVEADILTNVTRAVGQLQNTIYESLQT